MYNLRYHIASLVSVFLALAVGLVLGTIVVERGMLDAQKKTLVQSLTEDFGAITAENNAMRAEVESSRAFGRASASYLVAGKLDGRTVVLLAMAGRNDALLAAQNAVTAAGGVPAVVTLRRPRAGLDDTGTAVRARGLTRANDTTDTAVLASRLASAVAGEWAGDSDRGAVALLQSVGVMTVEGLPRGTRVDGIVLVASAEASADPFATAIGSDAAARGIPVVAAEVIGQETGSVEAAAAAGLSGVDDVDRPEGVVSLVWVLAEGAKGHFGIERGATAAFPELRR